MGIWSTVTGLLVGNSKAGDIAQTAVKGVVDGLDHWKFSDEEKAEMSLEAAKIQLEHVRASLGESTIRSITRRIIAWAVIGLGMFLTLYSLLMYTIGAIWDKESLKEVSRHSYAMLDTWWPIIAIIGTFYFGVHVLRSMQK